MPVSSNALCIAFRRDDEREREDFTAKPMSTISRTVKEMIHFEILIAGGHIRFFLGRLS